MATENQIEANRLNAQHCTGPKTEEGKARSSQNALKTGLYSPKEVIATESRDDYEALVADYYDHFAPATPQECSLLDALVRYEWLSRRYMAADTALWNYFMADDKVPCPGRAFMRQAENLSKAGRYFNNARKGFTQTLKELKALQAERKSLPSRDSNGAVTQSPNPSETQLNQQPATKLVSFRQPELRPQPESTPQIQTTDQGAETPPLAA